MGKYTDMESLVSSVFASAEWLAETIVTHPSNFEGDVVSNEYIRMKILSVSGEAFFGKLDNIHGQVIIDIFTPAGEGPKRSSEIADTLDKYLVGRVLTSSNGCLQLGMSYLVGYGADKANEMLYRAIYTLNFTYFKK
jgi:hypothetical protein